MICACIDIGSNTTRLLVAEPVDGRLRELLRQRAFTRIGKSLVLNPGSTYEEGILQAALVTIDEKKRKVKSYQLVNG